MEFNECTRGTGVLDMIDAMYAEAGYKRPAVVFWNINARRGNDPVRWDDAGTQIVSGFSPSILNTALTGEEDMRTPEQVMLDTLNQERYDKVRYSPTAVNG